MKKLLTLILALITASFFYFYLNFWLTGNLQVRNFVIAGGEGVNQISAHLSEQGIIRNEFIFEIYVWIKGLGSKMQIGSYEIATQTSIARLVHDFTALPQTRERKITVIEGWTVRDIGFYFANLGIARAEELQELVGFQAVNYRTITTMPQPKDFGAEYDFLADKPLNLGLEGYLFPDTYRIRANADVEDIIRKMLDNFGKKLTPELRAEIERQGKPIFDIVIMASLLEAEVRTPQDRALVSDIFWRRLRLQMPLQADSTINYFTFKKNAQSEVADLKKDSLWNTYTHQGLPLGPVGNPGLESIQAAIYPKPNSYLYFLTDKDGGVHYAKTFKEHLGNKQKYLK